MPTPALQLDDQFGYSPAAPRKERITSPGPAIKLNQVGYLPAVAKVARVTVASETAAGLPFSLVDAVNGRTVWQGATTRARRDKDSGEWLAEADFSAWRTPGRYRLEMPGCGSSPCFRIDTEVYREVYALAARSYYLQRCGWALDDPGTGLAHAACHLGNGVLREPPGDRLNATGGWHDAGDYGKYVPTAAVTVAQLLLAYELRPSAFRPGDLDLPGNIWGLPDLLVEVAWELAWMLKMQRADGGVRHKVYTRVFPGMIRPEDDAEPRLVYGVGTADTASFAGAMAIAARVYRRFYPALAGAAWEAATRALAYLATHPAAERPENDGTGIYATTSVKDEIFWAYAEAALTSGLTACAERARHYLPVDLQVTPIGWDDQTTLGLLAYCRAEAGEAGPRRRIREMFRVNADRVAARVEKSGYGVALGQDEYVWASNKTALAHAVNLLLADFFRPAPRYRRAALDQLHYILGVNCLGKSFLTGAGTDYPRFPHHRLVEATGRMVPGLLVGGPNDHAEDGHYQPGLGCQGYRDEGACYSCNEYAIDYNAPLIWVAAWLG